MFQVIVRQGRKIVRKQTFSAEQAAWDFFDRFSATHTCEFRDIRVLKAI